MILIVGGAGYIGSHVNKMLSEMGYDTIVLDNLVYGHTEAVKWGKLEIGDIGNRERLEEVFDKYAITGVLHFAAYAYVGESVSNPSKYYNNNVSNTIKLLDAMVNHGVKNIVFSSSCATYGIPDMIPITEEMPQRPINPYGATKLMVERILKDYSAAYGIRYCCLRYFNAAGDDHCGMIGESHTPETHIIPLILKAVKDGGRVKVFGSDYNTPDGTCIRDYIHVTDLADAHVRAYTYLKNGGESISLNLGNSKGRSVLELIKTAERITGKTIDYTYESRRPGDPPELVGSNVRAREVLGWCPQHSSIETIIRDAWNWETNRSY